MLLKSLAQSQLTGATAFEGQLLNLPERIIDKENRSSKGSITCAVELKKSFERYLKALNDVRKASPLRQDLLNEENLACDALIEQLQVLKTRLHGQNDSEAAETEEELEFARAFYATDGWQFPLNFLENVALPLLKGSVEGDQLERNLVDICTYCLIVLKDLSFSVPELSEALGDRDQLICILIDSLTILQLYEFIALFCTGILGARKSSVFALDRLPNIDSLVENFNACQLVCFCRILPCVTVDPAERLITDYGGHLKSFELLDQRRRFAIGEALETDIVTRNQLLLVKVTKLLIPRIVQLLRDCPSEEREKNLWLGKSSKYWQTVDLNVLDQLLRQDEQAQPVSDIVSMGASPYYDETLLDRNLGQPQSSAFPSMKTYFKVLLRNGLLTIANLLKSAANAIMMWFNRSRSPHSQQLEHSNEMTSLVAEAQFVVEENVADEIDAPEDLLDESDYVMGATFWSHRMTRDLWQLTQRLDAASVLSTLCIGPCRRIVQDSLSAYGLVPSLIERFDALPWDPSLVPSHLPVSARVHGSGCECDPHGAFKGQLLRLVHNFCDRESDNKSNKRQLFSHEELAAMDWNYEQLLEGQSPPFGWQRINISFRPPLARNGMSDTDFAREQELDALRRLNQLGLPGGCPAEHGLAWRIAAVLCAGNSKVGDAALHFWIFAALESLLRGSPRETKMMVCSWGVLRGVIAAIMDQNPTEGSKGTSEDDLDKAGFLQTSFDLLGELIKDNPSALAWLCNEPCEVFGEPPGPTAFSHVCSVAMNHLVDGNVFLRALALTLRRNPRNVAIELSRQWLEKNVAHLSWALWSAVKIEDVSQENLCCLNTAVVLLTFARWDSLLEAFVERVVATTLADFPSYFLEQLDLRNPDKPHHRFRKLMWFWRCYYSCRVSDRRSLEHSSGIKFDELEKTVAAICDADAHGQCILTGKERLLVPYYGTTIAVTAHGARIDPWDRL